MLTMAGWSYGLGGNLAKAPRFEQIEEFDKSQYSLFKVHLRIDERGFIWVNLDAAETPTISWEEQFEGVDTQPRLQNFDMKDYSYDHTWTMDGCNFNWKTLVENYNEVSSYCICKRERTLNYLHNQVLPLPHSSSGSCSVHQKHDEA
jgi:phenylpropionate dioxygenase-like ring-hydroxylating dioxygenase large terminal subunit